MNIRLHIDELILEGFAPRDRDLIVAAFEAELGRLFSERGVPQGLIGGGSIPRIDASSFQIAGTQRPPQIGAQIAQSIYGGLAQ
jgi:hypothetical protein